jgi:hypothetical protein
MNSDGNVRLPGRPRDGDFAVLERLPHHLERRAFELRQLIENKTP